MKLEYLIIHTTDTPENRNVTSDDIRAWHTNPKPNGNGWKKVGYTDMIHLDGSLENLTPFDQDDDVDGYEITNGVRGINSFSRHFVYVGGKGSDHNPKDTRTIAQRQSMEIYVKYMVLRHKSIKVAGHNQFSDKACPSFDVPEWLKSIGIKEENIYEAS